ncbi:RNA polymerase II C-terminal domain phosphatase-like 2 [Neltuma alba]|uniref:RNA polymerase II C-terminal domain phosphatase-like 2 n=1 Tax=Neltuma alba TaxID=207710 RepID=UPI0010A44704|nr:RNA polymerase II C-terminal domain phosphatase-like 2 [Prosopis alba]
MSRLGFKSVFFLGELRLGELDVIPVSDQNFHLPNEIRIHHLSPRSERCHPLSVLQTISAFSVRCKLESSLPVEQPDLINLHASCFYELQTAVTLVGDEEVHLVAMPSRRKKFPCFWCYSVPAGLYAACLRMLNLRCLAIVFDLDETLIVANTMKSFEDRIETLRGWLACETDPLRISGMSTELKRYMDDRKLLKQYVENDCVVDNGKIFKVQWEEVPQLSDSHGKVVRPVIRLQERDIILTRINPEICDTSVLVRLRPAWEDLKSYLTANGRKRFEVYVCTMAERDYALEMWRLLDPEAHLINSKQLLDRVICVKSGSRKSLQDVFQNSMGHPRMAMVIDDRSKVWEDRDQPRVHVVPAFTPYYAPLAERANTVPVLCVARNVACNVRGYFFKEFDEKLLQRIAEVFYEDDVETLPHPVDVSNYLMAEEAGFVPNNSCVGPISEGIYAAEVERRLKEYDERASVGSDTGSKAKNVMSNAERSGPTAGVISNTIFPGSSRNLSPSLKPGLLGPPVRHDGFSVDCDNDMKRGLLTLRRDLNTKNQCSGESPLISRPLNEALPSPMQPKTGLGEDHMCRRGQGNDPPFVSVKESKIAKSDEYQAQEKFFSPTLPDANLPSQSSLRNGEPSSVRDSQRHNLLQSPCQPAGDAACQNHLSSNGKEIQSEAGRLNFLPSLSIRVLQEIGRHCSSKVEFRSIVSTSKDWQFSVEVLFTGEKIGFGMGRTKMDAQQQAAENALHRLAEKYVAHMKPRCEGVGQEFDKLSLNHENGFLWEAVDLESSELERANTLSRESTSKVGLSDVFDS